MIRKKDLREVVVDLTWKETDLEEYDAFNSDICFLKDQCKTKAYCKQLYDWIGLKMCFLIALDAITQYQSLPIVAPSCGAGAAPPGAPTGDKNNEAELPSDDASDSAAGGGAPPRRSDPSKLTASFTSFGSRPTTPP